MDYSALFVRSWRLVWKNKFLLVLGILITALSNAGGESPLPRLLDLLGVSQYLPQSPIPPRFAETFAPPEPLAIFQTVFSFAWQYGFAGLITAAILILVLLILIGVVVIVARGALIAAAASLDADQPISLGAALREGWRKAWTLILIATIPPIPITIAAIIAVLIATAMVYQAGGAEFLTAPADVQQRVVASITFVSIVIALPFALITAVLSVLSHLADRACVLEDARAIPAFRRSAEVLRVNAGSALIVLLFQIVIEVAARTVLTVPRLAAGVCFPLIPLLWIIVGVMRAYFITLWTLVWRRWTIPPIIEG